MRLGHGLPVESLALHGLFVQRVPGDEALLRLARLRFDQVGLAAEVYAGTPDELERMLQFAPAAPRLPMVHLDRGLDMLRPQGRDAVKIFMSRFAGRVGGLVVHDKPEMARHTDALVQAMTELGRHAASTAGAPWLFLEYAAGLELDWFAELAQRLRDVPAVSLCVDIGHVGVSEARRNFRQHHPQLDLTALHREDERLPELVDLVQESVAGALPAVLELTRRLGGVAKPVHYHLHDGHPLVPGLADHFSFLTQLPVPFPLKNGRYSLPPMYGPRGLAAILDAAMQGLGRTGVSFTLEIHQAEGQLPLDDAADLFRHWADTTNAQRTNYWLSVLVQNAILARSALDLQ
jgi:hypothetical protein